MKSKQSEEKTLRKQKGAPMIFPRREPSDKQYYEVFSSLKVSDKYTCAFNIKIFTQKINEINDVSAISNAPDGRVMDRSNVINN